MKKNDFIFDQDFLNKLGVSEWGYTEEETPVYFSEFQKWIEKKHHLPLKYLEGERHKLRANIKNYFPSFQSAFVFIFSYRQIHSYLNEFYKKEESNGLKIASYTIGFEGMDYHLILREKLNVLAQKLSIGIDNFEFSLSIDMHPVLERDLARRAGIGWQGKNSMLITRESGSFFIIASILTNKKYEIGSSKLETDHCGQCTRCIDACPTSAIDINTRTIKAIDCISTFTIEEFKLDTIPSDKMNLESGYIFGCDICQDVCPWNKRLDRKNIDEDKKIVLNNLQNNLVNFFLVKSSENIKEKIEKMSNNEFKSNFKNTSFERSGKRGILKNLVFYLKNI